MKSSFYITVPLPSVIQQTCKRLCFGLPNVQWQETNDFQLTICPLGPANGAQSVDIQNKLNEIVFSPFTLTLSGIGYKRPVKTIGTVWVGVAPSEELSQFRKTIIQALSDIEFKIDKEARSFTPHIVLGNFDKLDDHRLAQFLESHVPFTGPCFAVDAFLLIKSHMTRKQIIQRTELGCFRSKRK